MAEGGEKERDILKVFVAWAAGLLLVAGQQLAQGKSKRHAGCQRAKLEEVGTPAFLGGEMRRNAGYCAEDIGYRRINRARDLECRTASAGKEPKFGSSESSIEPYLRHWKPKLELCQLSVMVLSVIGAQKRCQSARWGRKQYSGVLLKIAQDSQLNAVMAR